MTSKQREGEKTRQSHVMQPVQFARGSEAHRLPEPEFGELDPPTVPGHRAAREATGRYADSMRQRQALIDEILPRFDHVGLTTLEYVRNILVGTRQADNEDTEKAP